MSEAKAFPMYYTKRAIFFFVHMTHSLRDIETRWVFLNLSSTVSSSSLFWYKEDWKQALHILSAFPITFPSPTR